ncbi:hypothetical protein [Scytonema sp. HK-05]|uniref:hypothetical protein n=1 Tax=Scytonema sp. HK-05 TaxID=1137095 RepID=UPI000ABEF5EA|nr:hypothetical protein [Scytonema sp. HK-05]
MLPNLEFPIEAIARKRKACPPETQGSAPNRDRTSLTDSFHASFDVSKAKSSFPVVVRWAI